MLRDQALTFQANEFIRAKHPRSNLQLLTGTVQDCSYEYLPDAITAVKTGMSKLLRGQNTLGWIAAVEITPSELCKSHALFVHPHIHALVWTPQFSPLDVSAEWFGVWQSNTRLGAGLELKLPIPHNEVKKAIFYLHKVPAFEALRQAPEPLLYEKLRPLLVGRRLIERKGMAAKRPRIRSEYSPVLPDCAVRPELFSDEQTARIVLPQLRHKQLVKRGGMAAPPPRKRSHKS